MPMDSSQFKKVVPLCPVFGQCGGCQYQDIAYPDELTLKETQLREVLGGKLGIAAALLESIVPSPREYHYRHRLDLKLLNSKKHGLLMGFSPESGFQVIPVQSCAIAREAISDFLPQLNQDVVPKLTAKHRLANVVVRCGDEGRVRWGGIGRRSLSLPPQDYLWTEIRGKKIFYSLDTFFQANLSILPRFIDRLRALELWGRDVCFFDLYSGVGLFGIALSDLAGEAVMIEENLSSVLAARHNIQYLGLKNITLRPGRVESELPLMLGQMASFKKVAMIDPPRDGLSAQVAKLLAEATDFTALLYLSCHPESLVRDLGLLLAGHWRIERVMPFDFFPKTRHIETLVLLKPK